MADLEPVNPLEPTATPAEADGTPEPTLAEHEAAFGSAPRPSADPEDEPEENPRRPPRDPTGKFTKPTRHRAESQKASPADVPRIAELTRRLRETEAERDALKTARPVTESTKPLAEIKPLAAAEKPRIDQFQEYGDYVEALADWKIAEARQQDRETASRDAAAAQIAQAWKTRVDDAKSRHADFEQVALLSPTAIPQGSLVDAWILEHKGGADVLYEIQRDSLAGGHLLKDLLALPLFEQVDSLSLLAQRLSPSTRVQAETTGAAAVIRPVARRPPTPVRTSAMQTSDEPPGDDASIAEHEKYYGQRRR